VLHFQINGSMIARYGIEVQHEEDGLVDQ
jgi:hypothetical protein